MEKESAWKNKEQVNSLLNKLKLMNDDDFVKAFEEQHFTFGEWKILYEIRSNLPDFVSWWMTVNPINSLIMVKKCAETVCGSLTLMENLNQFLESMEKKND